MHHFKKVHSRVSSKRASKPICVVNCGKERHTHTAQQKTGSRELGVKSSSYSPHKYKKSPPLVSGARVVRAAGRRQSAAGELAPSHSARQETSDPQL